MKGFKKKIRGYNRKAKRRKKLYEKLFNVGTHTEEEREKMMSSIKKLDRELNKQW